MLPWFSGPGFQGSRVMIKIKDLRVLDIRFPTARAAVGTDAMHPDPDYSAAYVILETNAALEGHGLTSPQSMRSAITLSAAGSTRSRRISARSGESWRAIRSSDGSVLKRA